MVSFSILLESNHEGDFRATVLSLPECQAQGATRDAALENAKQLLAERLSTAEIIAVDLQSKSAPQSAAQRMAGNFQNDPTWDDFQASIATYRQELDAELAAEYRQMNEAEQRGNSAA
jgi:predicted RNase H-like HicB family nuclease